jgi:hypothetical protein
MFKGLYVLLRTKTQKLKNKITMKKINLYTVAALGISGLALASCGDSFLDTTSKTELNSTSFYKTEAQADYALTGCYDQYQRTVSEGAWPGLFLSAEMGSDDAFGGGSPTDGCNRFDKMNSSLSTDKENTFETTWTTYYDAIYNDNQLINSLGDIKFTSDATKATLSGEVYALRGMEYFDLVKLFENVPLLTTATRDIVPQATPDSVYYRIVKDLTYAAQNIPATANLGSSNFGHITKYAAEAMLARVYLFYDGVYNNNGGGTVPGGLTKAQALAYCEDVISSGNFKLESDFSKLWPAACAKKVANDGTNQESVVLANYDEASPEFIFAMKFNNDQNYQNGTQIDGNRFIIDMGMRGLGDGSACPYAQGWGQCPISPAAYTMYDASDTRRDASIINAHSLGVYDTQASGDLMDYTGYVNKKYCPICYTDGSSITTVGNDKAGDFQLGQDQNWVMMRYSDVLLMAAELGSANAGKYFNMVRDRAYGDTAHELSAPTRAQIWEERHKEFMGEGIRYYDLMRQGLDAFATTLGNQGKDDGVDITVYSNSELTNISGSYDASIFRATRGFWQIPTTEITLSGGVYKQNAGW